MFFLLRSQKFLARENYINTKNRRKYSVILSDINGCPSINDVFILTYLIRAIAVLVLFLLTHPHNA